VSVEHTQTEHGADRGSQHHNRQFADEPTIPYSLSVFAHGGGNADRTYRDDLLNGEAGDASLLGGPGNDRLDFQDTGQLFGSGRFEGGPGFDMLEIVTWWGLKPLLNSSLPSLRKAKFRLLMVGADL
jgi:hypothetical protein